MSRTRLLATLLVISLIAAACGTTGGDDTTTTAEEGNGTAETVSPDGCAVPDAGLGNFPYVESGAPEAIQNQLDCIEFANGEAQQAPCQGCAEGDADLSSDQTSGDFEGGQCTHVVDYVPGQLLASVDLVDSGDLDPFIIGPGDVSLADLQLAEGFELYLIDGDPIDVLTTIISDIGVDEWNRAPQASPNYLFHPTPGWKFSPVDQPMAADSDWLIADQKFSGVVGVVDSFGTDGHGEFISSIVAALGAEAVPYPVDFTGSEVPAGDALLLSNDTIHVANLIMAAASGSNAVNVSLGTYECLTEIDGSLASIPPVMLDQVITTSEARVVAAAGNDAHQEGDDKQPRFYPAAYDSVIGVGALGWNPSGEEWVVASFTNTNSADTYAPGVRIVANVGDEDDPEVLSWSGTSFAAPHIAACVAAGAC